MQTSVSSLNSLPVQVYRQPGTQQLGQPQLDWGAGWALEYSEFSAGITRGHSPPSVLEGRLPAEMLVQLVAGPCWGKS